MWWLWIIGIIGINSALWAQTTQSGQEPLELPEFIITGKAEPGIPLYQKPLPHPPALLRTEDFHRHFYSLEKIAPPPLPLPSFPEPPRLPVLPKGAVTVGIGLFPTVLVGGNYQWKWRSLVLKSGGEFEYSRGHRENAQYQYLYLWLDLLSEETLGAKRLISNTKFQVNRYRLYAKKEAPKRQVYQWQTVYQHRVWWQGLPLQFYGQMNWWGLHQQTVRQEWLLSGGLEVTMPSDVVLLRALKTDLRLGNSLGRFVMTANVHATVDWQVRSTLWLSAQIGVQGGRDVRRFIIYPQSDIQLQYRFHPHWSAGLQVQWQMQTDWVAKLWEHNPYLALTTATAFVQPLSLVVQGWYHPTTSLTVTARVGIRMGEQPTWIPLREQATFVRTYQSTKTLLAGLEWQWHIRPTVQWDGVLRFHWSRTDQGGSIPFLPAFWGETAVQYQLARSWQVRGILSTRSALETGIEEILPGFVTLSMDVHYQPVSLWMLSLKINNLLDAPLYQWNGYRKRGVYAELQFQRVLP